MGYGEKHTGENLPLAAKSAAYTFVREDSGSKFLQNSVYALARLHEFTSKKTVIFIIVSVRTSYLTQHFNP